MIKINFSHKKKVKISEVNIGVSLATPRQINMEKGMQSLKDNRS